jgi:hypothetical protein
MERVEKLYDNVLQLVEEAQDETVRTCVTVCNGM